MGIYMDEPMAALAATAFTLAGGIVGAWLRGRRAHETDQLPSRAPGLALDARLGRLEQIAEATQLEVERVAEGQRFTTRILAERAAPNVPPPIMPGRPTDYRTPH